VRPAALLFDVFGTLVDWRTGVAGALRPVFAAKGIAADPLAVAARWRAEYDPAMAAVREGRRAYAPLDVLHREMLDRALAGAGLEDRLGAAERDALAPAWERLPAWPDVPEALDRLGGRFLLAPCSNGSIALMVRLARHAGFRWDAILGAEIARDYKPKPAVYLASAAALGLAPAEVMMVAAHNGDLAAARAAGLMTGFFPRPAEHGPGQASDLVAEGPWDLVAESPGALATALGA
jgi:2-haloacid dehalogenase